MSRGVLFGIPAATVPPPPPPPPPPAGFTDLADIHVSAVSAGEVLEIGVPVSTSAYTSIASARINASIMAQVDNVVLDRQGFVRWFMLSAIVSAPGIYRLAVSSSVETADPVEFSDGTPTYLSFTTIVDTSTSAHPNQDLSSTNAIATTICGTWRRGPVVTETLVEDLGEPLHTWFLIANYANGQQRTTIYQQNGWSIVGAGTSAAVAQGVVYTVSVSSNLTHGIFSQTSVPHQAYAMWHRELGVSAAHANIVPMGWTSVADAGTWEYIKSTRSIENFYREDTPLALTPTTTITVAGLFGGQYGGGNPATPGTLTFGGSSGSIGWLTMSQGSPGADKDIGPHPEYYLDGARWYNVSCKRLIDWHVDKRMGMPYYWRDRTTHGFYGLDTGIDYVGTMSSGAADSTSRIGGTRGSWVHNQNIGFSHWGAMARVPYLLQGKFTHILIQIMQHVTSWANNSTLDTGGGPNLLGNQLFRHALQFRWVYNDRGSGAQQQLRTQGWAVRTNVHGAAMFPTTDPLVSLVGWRGSYGTSAWSAVPSSVGNAYVSVLTSVTVSSAVPSQYTGGRFYVDGIHQPAPTEGVYKFWMWNMAVESLHIGGPTELNVNTTMANRLATWVKSTPILMVNDRTESIPDFAWEGNCSNVLWNTTLAGFYSSATNSGTSCAKSMGEVYEGMNQMMNFGGLELALRIIKVSDGGGPYTVSPPHPVSITITPDMAVTGTSVAFQVFMSAGEAAPYPVTASWPWYNRWKVLAVGPANADATIVVGGQAILIRNLTSAYGGTGIVGPRPEDLTAFVTLWTATSIKGIRLGYPHPGDHGSPGEWPIYAEGDYIGHMYHVAVFAKDASVSGGQEMYEWMYDYMNAKNLYLVNSTHAILPRASQ